MTAQLHVQERVCGDQDGVGTEMNAKASREEAEAILARIKDRGASQVIFLTGKRYSQWREFVEIPAGEAIVPEFVLHEIGHYLFKFALTKAELEAYYNWYAGLCMEKKPIQNRRRKNAFYLYTTGMEPALMDEFVRLGGELFTTAFVVYASPTILGREADRHQLYRPKVAPFVDAAVKWCKMYFDEFLTGNRP